MKFLYVVNGLYRVKSCLKWYLLFKVILVWLRLLMVVKWFIIFNVFYYIKVNYNGKVIKDFIVKTD